jgi:hypothetical protein
MRILVAAVAAVLAVAGCASTPTVGSGAGPAPTGSSQASVPGTSTGGAPGSVSGAPGTGKLTAPAPVSSLDSRCPAQIDEGQHNAAYGRQVPPDIQVAWVLLCTVKPQPDGTRDLLVERSDSDPAALLAALRVADQPPSKGACPMLAVVVPYFAFVQRDGRALVPRIPVTGCRLPQPPVLQALYALHFQVIARHRMP